MGSIDVVLTPGASGATATGNLAALCRRHHRLKDEGGWQLRQPSPGTLTWTGPRGTTTTVVPEPDDPPPF